ncbi:MAG TPA: cytochrome P450 [Acidimicrobiales bacterium]|nr:cytochrome P450 [Acidimicrobiales bacterium]
MQMLEVNLADPKTFVERVPFEVFDRLRRESPVFRHEPFEGRPGFWGVTRYDDVQVVNRDNVLFSSNRQGTLLTVLDDESLAQQRLMMLNMDPPLHTRYRLLVNKGFTPRMVARLEDDIRARTRETIQAAVERGECDFVTDIAAELPLQVIAEIIGVPQEDRRLVFDWSNRMVGSEDPEYQQAAEAAQTAAMELYAYCHQLVQEKRGHPGEDVMTVLLNAEVEGHTLTELELDMFFMLLCVAGNETTRNLIAHGQLALFENPDQAAILRDDASAMPTAVEEMLRWGTPVMNFRRTATADTVVGGQEIAEGDAVVMFYISANRDETHFEDPYRFDVRRTPNEHVAFGAGGPHFCLGANLARMEIRVMFEELERMVPDMEQTGPAERLCSNFINGIKHLPVRFPSGVRS